mmetsp:Transcript_118845/g.296393  ORF Transcript_118845/g.296393 Transcript_118845/m.296393 type:complete len:239 (+) Transcript_118845:1605-2321(+)
MRMVPKRPCHVVRGHVDEDGVGLARLQAHEDVVVTLLRRDMEAVRVEVGLVDLTEAVREDRVVEQVAQGALPNGCFHALRARIPKVVGEPDPDVLPRPDAERGPRDLGRHLGSPVGARKETLRPSRPWHRIAAQLCNPQPQRHPTADHVRLTEGLAGLREEALHLADARGNLQPRAGLALRPVLKKRGLVPSKCAMAVLILLRAFRQRGSDLRGFGVVTHSSEAGQQDGESGERRHRQ